MLCAHCCEAVWVPKYAIGRRKYCSMSCSRLGSRNRVSVVCANCGAKFLKHPSNLKTKTGYHFCNKVCKDAAQRLDSGVGYTLPHYKDGAGGSYRRRALREHGECCNSCGYVVCSSMLDVHHKDGNRDNNNLENLEVLCVWCHALETRTTHVHAWCGNLLTTNNKEL